MKKDYFIRKALVTHIVDGDTIDAIVDLGYQVKVNQRLRLFGINTPERGQAGFREVKNYVLLKLLNREVYIRSRKGDSFGRYLADIYYQDNGQQVHLNKELLDKKLARPYRQ